MGEQKDIIIHDVQTINCKKQSDGLIKCEVYSAKKDKPTTVNTKIANFHLFKPSKEDTIHTSISEEGAHEAHTDITAYFREKKVCELSGGGSKTGKREDYLMITCWDKEGYEAIRKKDD